MSRIYDNWEKLVGAVLRREKDRRIALFQSFSSSSSADVSSRSSFDFAVDADFSSRFSFDSSVDADFSSRFSFNAFVGDVHVPAVSRSSSQKLDPADLSSQSKLFFRNVMATEYEKMKKATKNFRRDMVLGEGRFGPVFKGWIHEHYLTAVKPGSGIAVAVKKLNNEEGTQGHKEWVDEINYLGQLRHPNLVKLSGYSFDKDNRILVYEFMARGSLENHLFTRGHESLPWATRIKVALGAARALAFLHDLEIPVVHGNVNSAKILSDGDFNAKLWDFSLARDDFSLAIEGPFGVITHVSTKVVGTYGYSAPEYKATGHSSTECDVYSFGVVLLELISGLRVIDRMRPKGKHNLMDWVKPYLRDRRRLPRIMDSRLEGQYPRKDAYRVAKIALQRVSSDPRLRPTMAEAVAALQHL